jgi:hypothetical protein
MRPTSTAKHFKKGVIRRLVEQLFYWSFHMEYMSRHTINEKACRKESITPISKRHRCMSKQGETSFDNMAMLAFSSTILLMSMRACYTMYDAKFVKECVEVAVFAAPIRLYMKNFMTK